MLRSNDFLPFKIILFILGWLALVAEGISKVYVGRKIGSQFVQK